jgi:hypothetical protein
LTRYWIYQAKRDTNLPDVFLIEGGEGDGQGDGGRGENAEADAKVEDPVSRPHRRKVDGEDDREKEQVDQPELVVNVIKRFFIRH